MARRSTGTAGLAIVMTLLGSVASIPAQNFGMGAAEKYFTIDWEHTATLRPSQCDRPSGFHASRGTMHLIGARMTGGSEEAIGRKDI